MENQQNIKYCSLLLSVFHRYCLIPTIILSFLSDRKQSVDDVFIYKLIHESPVFYAENFH